MQSHSDTIRVHAITTHSICAVRENSLCHNRLVQEHRPELLLLQTVIMIFKDAREKDHKDTRNLRNRKCWRILKSPVLPTADVLNKGSSNHAQWVVIQIFSANGRQKKTIYKNWRTGASAASALPKQIQDQDIARKSIMKSLQSSHIRQFPLNWMHKRKMFRNKLARPYFEAVKRLDMKGERYMHTRSAKLIFSALLQHFEVSSTPKLDLTTWKCVKNPFVWQPKPGSIPWRPAK